jgi:hypothetical protein
MTQTFQSIPVSQTFDYCGNLYRKRSTRTAEIVKSRTHNPDSGWQIHEDYSGQWGFFPNRQAVNQEAYWWQAMEHRATLATTASER